MVESTPVVRAARNGYFVLILALFGAGMYRIIVLQEDGLLLSGLWVVGVVVYYGSKYYYEQHEPGTNETDPSESA